MKYLVSCILVLPLMTSCVDQELYYEPNAYNSPPPRVEVQPDYSTNNRHHHSHGVSRPPVQHNRAYHGHEETRGNNIIVTSPPPQAQVEVEQNIHKQSGNNHVRSANPHRFNQSQDDVPQTHGHY